MVQNMCLLREKNVQMEPLPSTPLRLNGRLANTWLAPILLIAVPWVWSLTKFCSVYLLQLRIIEKSVFLPKKFASISCWEEQKRYNDIPDEGVINYF